MTIATSRPPGSSALLRKELETIVPEAVLTGEDGQKSVAYGNMTAILVEAMKQQLSGLFNNLTIHCGSNRFFKKSKPGFGPFLLSSMLPTAFDCQPVTPWTK
jgi:hypothetical protein